MLHGEGLELAEELFRTQNPATEVECVLHKSNWDAHVAKRIELVGHVGSVESTVRSPLIAIRSADGAIHKYSLGFGTGKFTGAYLLVIERENHDGTDSVRTAWFTREVMTEGVPLYWQGKKLS